MSAIPAPSASPYAQRVLRVLVHIQRNLDQPLPLEELAGIAHFSPFHFHRIFRGMVGESVKQHIRRLRLERAAGHLKLGNRTVLAIALEAGYETHESFTRAFKHAFGMPPSAFRDTHQHPHIEAAVNIHHGSADSLQFTPLQHSAFQMEVQIKELPARQVVFLRHVGPYDQVGSAWEQLCEWAARKDLFGKDTLIFGASYDDPDVTPPDKLRYEACLTVQASVQGEGPIGVREVPGGTFATTIHEGPYQQLGETYAKLFGGWLAQSGEEPAQEPCLEFYLNDPETTEPEDLLTEICIPLKKS